MTPRIQSPSGDSFLFETGAPLSLWFCAEEEPQSFLKPNGRYGMEDEAQSFLKLDDRYGMAEEEPMALPEPDASAGLPDLFWF